MNISQKHQNLAVVYDESFVESLDLQKRDEAVLRDVLLSNCLPQREEWRRHLDSCLGVARRHGLLDRQELLGRLRSHTLDDIHSAFCELATGMYLESIGCELQFYPPGNTGRVLEFKISRSGMTEVAVEVKALLKDDLDRRHDSAIFDVTKCIQKCPKPFAIGVRRLTPNQHFSRKELVQFLEEQLSKVQCTERELAEQMIDLPPYVDPRGLKAEFSALPTPGASYACYLWSFHPMREVTDRDLLRRRLMDAYRQLPEDGSANMVVIDVTYRGWPMREDVLTVLFGGRYVQRGSNDREYTTQGQGEGFWRETNGHSKLGAVMLILWLVTQPDSPFVRVFHNPWALCETPAGLFPDGIIHYTLDPSTRIIHANCADSEWF